MDFLDVVGRSINKQKLTDFHFTLTFRVRATYGRILKPGMTFRARAFLIDLSGTIHIENSAVTGAVEAVEAIKNANIPCLFVTNTTKVRCVGYLNQEFAKLKKKFPNKIF